MKNVWTHEKISCCHPGTLITLSGRFLNDQMNDHGVDYCYLVIVLSKLLTVFQAPPSLSFHVGMHTSCITLHLVSIKPKPK